jgi:hypothetical protein
LKSNCIIVPVYKNFVDLTNEELISLAQLYKVLGNHSIYLVGPNNFNWKVYITHAANRDVYPQFKEFSNHYFEGISGYNELMLSINFYKKFQKFKYILLYQLDAYVFRDELNYWCSKGYDYIGSPWFEGFDRPISNKIIGVGNGGFSLRNVDSAIRLNKRMNFLRKLRNFWYKSHLQSILRFERFLQHTRNYFKIKDPGIMSVMDNPSFAIEDRYWSILSSLFKDYNISPVEEAIKFGFEVKPSILFKSNNYQLPFGCHAWEKYDPDFWKEFIPMNELIKEK